MPGVTPRSCCPLTRICGAHSLFAGSTTAWPMSRCSSATMRDSANHSPAWMCCLSARAPSPDPTSRWTARRSQRNWDSLRSPRTASTRRRTGTSSPNSSRTRPSRWRTPAGLPKTGSFTPRRNSDSSSCRKK